VHLGVGAGALGFASIKNITTLGEKSQNTFGQFW